MGTVTKDVSAQPGKKLSSFFAPPRSGAKFSLKYRENQSPARVASIERTFLRFPAAAGGVPRRNEPVSVVTIDPSVRRSTLPQNLTVRLVSQDITPHSRERIFLDVRHLSREEKKDYFPHFARHCRNLHSISASLLPENSVLAKNAG